jgi:hypothetical protein
MAALHRRTHPTFVAGCFACHLASLHLSPGYTETKARETVLDRDLDAYARMRKNGVQPINITGAARLEMSDTREGIEMPHHANRIGAAAARQMRGMELP